MLTALRFGEPDADGWAQIVLNSSVRCPIGEGRGNPTQREAKP